jgi:lipopolysaccharide export system permease protein
VRILDRYLLREFIAFTLLGLGSFVSLFIIVDLFEKLDIFVDHHTSLPIILRYYGHSLPTTVTEVLPLAMLLGSLLGLSQLKKHNEVTAMQGSGQSPWRLARPLLILALLVAAAQYGLNEWIGPRAYAEQQRILLEEIKQQSGADRESQADVRLLGSGSTFYVAQYFDAKNAILSHVSIQFLGHRTLRGRIDAAAAVYDGGVWRFENGFYRTFPDSGEMVVPFRTYETSELQERPRDFARINADPFHMSMKNLLQFARRVRESGGGTQKHMTNFHLRASFPVADLIMVLLGTALSLRVVRGGNIALSFGISVSIGFTYFAFIRVGQALGYSGTLPPMLAAWLGNLVFGTIGVVLFWKVTR